MWGKRQKVIKCLLASLLFLQMFLGNHILAEASTPYLSYTYDSYGNAVVSPDLYKPVRVVYGKDIGVSVLIRPEDFFIGSSGDIYILDSGSNRVIVTDNDFNQLNIIDKFDIDGTDSPLNNAKGITVDSDGQLYIADTGNNRVIRVNEDGKILEEITKPKSEYFSAETDFLPTKLVIDRAFNLYILSTGIYQGLVIIDRTNTFQGFYGSDKVVTTVQALTDFFWKQFMTKEQKEAMSNYVPPEVKNIDITENDFIFTITNSPYIPLSTQKTEMDSIRKLNPKGADSTVRKMSFMANKAMETDAKNLNFADICSDKNGFANLVDNDKGKIYQFDSNMNLITAFGTLGDYAGAFSMPSAIETYEDRIYVLDLHKSSITVFGLTDFGEKVHNALKLYNAGKYEEAIGPWKEVLALDTNYELAYIGIGNALINQQKYLEAMHYFELARDSVKYNEAFREYRIQVTRSNFNWIILTGIALIAIYSIYKKRRSIALVLNKTRKRKP